MASIDDLVAGFAPVTPASIIAVGAVLPALASVAVALRFYVKTKRRTELSIDDWLILFALAICIGLGVMMIVGK